MKMLKASSSEGLTNVNLLGYAAGTFFGHRFLEFRHVILDAPQTCRAACGIEVNG
jgi:hypothetical protein